jgi:hypothetical protein
MEDGEGAMEDGEVQRRQEGVREAARMPVAPLELTLLSSGILGFPGCIFIFHFDGLLRIVSII